MGHGRRIGMESRMEHNEITGIALYSVCDIIWDQDNDGLKSQWTMEPVT